MYSWSSTGILILRGCSVCGIPDFGEMGLLLILLRGYSFYGLISPDKLAAMVEKAGFDILTQQLNEGSAYLVAQNSATPTPVNFEVHETAFYHITRAPVGVKPKRNTKMA